MHNTRKAGRKKKSPCRVEFTRPDAGRAKPTESDDMIAQLVTFVKFVLGKQTADRRRPTARAQSRAIFVNGEVWEF